jgi:ferric-dicitrate binding protein FerR (iron transport regulator)
MGQEQKEYTWQLVARMLAGEATGQELEELEHLLRSNPELYYPLQIITGLWRQSGPEEQKKAEEAFSRHLDRMAALHIDLESDSPSLAEEMKQTKARRRRLFVGIGVGCAVVGLVAGTFLFRRPADQLVKRDAVTGRQEQLSEVTTREGSRTNLYLPDGTRVWLNAASRITYAKDFGAAGAREVTLSGEAFFDVARNPARPFVIHTSRVDIKVLGTSFNIKSYPTENTTEAVLVRGSIEVDIHNRANKTVILKPNEKLIIDNDDSASVLPRTVVHHDGNLFPRVPVTIRKPNYEPTTGAMIETSWVDNKLIFRDESFDELARQMERWYGDTIRFARPELEQLQFTGSFEQETIKQALDALKLTAAFNYSLSGNQINIY